MIRAVLFVRPSVEGCAVAVLIACAILAGNAAVFWFT
jgi:hypothetical protein